MKLNFTYLPKLGIAALLLLAATQVKAQSKPPIDSVLGQKANMLMNAATQVKGLKDFAGGFMPAKKPKDTVYVFVSNIKYGNPDLTALKTDIGKISKNNVSSMLKDGVIVLKVIGKKDASVLYDALDKNNQKMFQPQDMDGNRMMLEYKP